VRTTFRVAALACAIAGVAVSAPAAWADDWIEPPVPLDTPAFFNNSDPDPVVAANARGDVVAAWELDIAPGEFACCLALRVAYRPAGGQFSVQTVAGSALVPASDPSVGIDDAGNAIVAWQASGAFEAVQYAVRPAGGSQWNVAELAGTSQQPAEDVVVAVAGGGAATFVWRRKNSPGDTHYLQAVRRAPDGAFGAVDNVTSPGSTTLDVRLPAAVATTASGDTTAAWVERDGSAPPVMYDLQAARAASGDFGAPGSITSQQAANAGFEVPGVVGQAIALDSQARAVLVFLRVVNPLAGQLELEYVTRSGSAAFGTTPVDIATGEVTGIPDVAVDSQGNAVAVWNRKTANNRLVEARARPAGGSFGQVQTLSDAAVTATVNSQEVAFDSDDAAIAVWSLCEVAGCRVHTARRPSGSDFGAVDILTPFGSYNGTRVAADGDGNAVAVWSQFANPKVAQLATFDGGLPRLSSISVPGAGATGQSLAFSAAAFDTWSPVQIGWSFGDGQSATGAAASHAFSAPGTYNVTVTAQDAAGNTATETRAVQVSSPVSPSGIDADGDGFTAGQDCNDGNAAIRPGATEVRGNAIDENCDGRAQPFLSIVSPVSVSWRVEGARTTLVRLRLRRLPSGASVQLRCSGRGCPFNRKSAGRPRRNALNALPAFGRRRTVAAGATLEVRITAPGRIGKVVRYTARSGKLPKVAALCLRPGARSPQRSC